jgi:hypothetical protein
VAGAISAHRSRCALLSQLGRQANLEPAQGIRAFARQAKGGEQLVIDRLIAVGCQLHYSCSKWTNADRLMSDETKPTITRSEEQKLLSGKEKLIAGGELWA